MNGQGEPRRNRITSTFSSTDYDVSFKVMIIGDSGVGKTCLLVRYKDGSFLNGNFISTVGIDFKNKMVMVDGKKVKLQIWDTAGQERFRSMTHNFFRDAAALLLVYDVCNAQSFANVANWIADVKRHASPNVTLVMIGNKSDCSSQRKVKYKDGEKLAKEYDIVFLETSAKTGVNVDLAFDAIAQEVYHKSLTAADLVGNQREAFNLKSYVDTEKEKTICC